MYDAIQQKEEGAIRRSAAAYEGTAKYEVGDLVWYLAPRLVPGKAAKITKRWTGPWKVVRKATEVHYVIKPASPVARISEVTAHVGRLRKYTGDVTAHQIPADIQVDMDGDEDATELPVGAAAPAASDPGQLPVHQPAAAAPQPSGQDRDPVEENLQEQPNEPPPLPPAPEPLRDAIWNPDADMENLPASSGPVGEEPATAMEEAAPEEEEEAMCPLLMTAIPIRVGARRPSNLNQAGAPMEFYAPFAITIPPLGTTRICLGLRVQLPAETELILQTRQNFQRRGLAVANPRLEANQELTMLITNHSQTEQRVSRGACVARAVLHRAVPQELPVRRMSRLSYPQVQGLVSQEPRNP